MAAAESRASRHVMVIAYAFAPASPIGTMRTLRFVKRLHAEGWSTTVVMAAPHTYEPQMPIDLALLREVPDSCEILHMPVLRPLERLGRLRRRRPARAGSAAGAAAAPGGAAPAGFGRRLRTAIDEITLIPDRCNGWIAPAIAGGLLATARRRPAAMYSTAPPWSGQVAALAIARLTRLPWVADFRDPWARAPWREKLPARIQRAAARLERRVIRGADAILFATATNRDEYLSTYGAEYASKFHVVPNGCDPAEFTGLTTSPSADHFVMVHAGSLYGARTPAPLLRAIANGIRSGRIDGSRFRLRLIGSIASDLGVPPLVAELELQGVVDFVPRKPRQEVIREMAAANCLLLLQPGTTVSIPGKLYEYLALGRPILALAEEGETSNLVRASGLGVAVAANDERAILGAIVATIAAKNDLVRPVPRALFDGNAAAGEALQIVINVAGGRRGPAERERSEIVLS
jgi:glycosyltransferase involved in cell wall biosynthesis